MIRIAQTSRGIVVFVLQGGSGDWYQVGLFGQQLARVLPELAGDEDELVPTGF
jgi:hypothetical protein